MRRECMGLRASVASIAIICTAFAATSARAQSSVGDASSEAANLDAAGDDSPVGDEASGGGDIIVTGSRLRGGFEQPTPVTVIDSSSIGDRAPNSIASVINEMPQFRNSVSQTANTRGSIGPAGTNTLDLRGLGDTRTLVLLDGMRLASTRDGGAPDTNSIPVMLVDSVDVVTGGASAAYGTNALAGVVSFNLKRDLEGFRGVVQAGMSDRSDNKSVAVNAAWGGRLGDNIRLLVGADYSDEKRVGSALTRGWGRREGGLIGLPANRAGDLPAQVFTEGVRFNNLSPGGLVTNGPLRGLTFLPGGQTGSFDFGTLSGGNQMAGSASNFGTSLNSYHYLKTPNRRGVIMGRVTAELGGDTEAWLDASYNFLRVFPKTGLLYYREANIVIRDDNPFLPASVQDLMAQNGLSQITIGRSNEDLGSASARNRTDRYRAAAGVRGSLGGSWKYDAFLNYGHVRYLYRGINQTFVANYNAAIYAVRDGTGNIVCGDLASNPNLSVAQRGQVQPGCVPLNPFGFGSPSEAALDYVTGEEVLVNRTDLYNAGLNITGELFRLPGGTVPIAFGVEARREDTDVSQGPFAGLFNVGNNRGYSGAYTVYEAYAETTLPILADVAFARSLEVNGAIRQADYSSFGPSTTWKVGAVWEPVTGLRFRVTRSRDLRAPTLGDLFKPGFNQTVQIRNPVTGVSASTAQINVNNPDLTPEIGDTLTAGVVLSVPLGGARVNLSADYYDIKIDDVISNVSPQNAVNLCLLNNAQEFCDAITFDAAFANGIASVQQKTYNAATQRAKGVDLLANIRAPLGLFGTQGTLSFNAVASYVDTLRTVNQSGVTQENAYITVPRWRWNLRTEYETDRWSAYLQLLGFGKTHYSEAVIGPEDEGFSPSLAQSISSNRFPSYTYMNAGISAFVGEGERFQLFATVDNLLDKSPPSNVFFSTANVYDLIGRTYKLGVRLNL
jgi:iron complex outermembrane receptor protein